MECKLGASWLGKRCSRGCGPLETPFWQGGTSVAPPYSVILPGPSQSVNSEIRLPQPNMVCAWRCGGSGTELLSSVNSSFYCVVQVDVSARDLTVLSAAVFGHSEAVFSLSRTLAKSFEVRGLGVFHA